MALLSFVVGVGVGVGLISDRKGTHLEVRQPFVCGRCNATGQSESLSEGAHMRTELILAIDDDGGHWILTVAYQSAPPPIGDAPFVYILKGSMTEL